VARLPPIVPALRICGEPTVRAASRRAGEPSSSRRRRVYVTPAPTRTAFAAVSMPPISATRSTVNTRSGRARPKFIATMRSVPPATTTLSASRKCTSASSRRRATTTGTGRSEARCDPKDTRYHCPPFKPDVRFSRIRLSDGLLVQHRRLRVADRPVQAVQALSPEPLVGPLSSATSTQVPSRALHEEAAEAVGGVVVDAPELRSGVAGAEVAAPASEH